nr:hypothetical protein [Salipiger mucosus]
MTRDDIAIVGAGAGETILGAEELDGPAIRVGTTETGDALALASDAALGARHIVVAGPHEITAGDWLEIEAANTNSFLDAIGDTDWRKTDSPLRGSLVRVADVDGNDVTLETGVHFEFGMDVTTLREIDLAENVTLERLSVDYGLGPADPSQFSNTLPAYYRDAAIAIEGTAGLHLADIALHDVPSVGINIAQSANLSADGLIVTGAHNRGGGGNGYAIQLRDVFDSRLVELTDQEMRHSVVFASWSSAAGNLVHIAETDRDVIFHGGRDTGNTVLVDRSLRDAAMDLLSPSNFFNDGTSYGAPTDRTANTVMVSELVGSRRDDSVSGTPGGDWLDGARATTCYRRPWRGDRQHPRRQRCTQHPAGRRRGRRSGPVAAGTCSGAERETTASPRAPAATCWSAGPVRTPWKAAAAMTSSSSARRPTAPGTRWTSSSTSTRTSTASTWRTWTRTARRPDTRPSCSAKRAAHPCGNPAGGCLATSTATEQPTWLSRSAWTSEPRTWSFKLGPGLNRRQPLDPRAPRSRFVPGGGIWPAKRPRPFARTGARHCIRWSQRAWNAMGHMKSSGL